MESLVDQLMSHQAVFLDRDGVVNDNTKMVNKPKDLILYPWTAAAIHLLNQADYLIFIVTNQGGIELGYFTAEDLEAIHQHLLTQLRLDNAGITEIVYCPHFNQECQCRKPKPGLILRLASKYQIDLDSSWMIGDRESDILAGQAAKCQTIKLGKPDPQANLNCENLLIAVEYILTKKNRNE